MIIDYPNAGRFDAPYGRDRLMAYGRNGTIYATALQLQPLPSHILLRPVHTGGPTGSCYIELPRDPTTLRAIARHFEQLATDCEAAAQSAAA